MIVMRKLVILILLLLLKSGRDMAYTKDLYVDAFTHFVDSILSYRYEKGDTICIKQVYGITDNFPKEINGYSIRIVHELNCDNIPKNTKYTSRYTTDVCYRQIYYIYPMIIGVSDTKGDLSAGIAINDGLVMSDEKKVICQSLGTLFMFEYVYCKETGNVEFRGMGSCATTREIPWLIK
ncbi:MAG: hypothetical protein K6F48_03110 [Paludibacteraceae bacterium]|nr:hypothetical protein [Paludibacteraceae bacterium]